MSVVCSVTADDTHLMKQSQRCLSIRNKSQVIPKLVTFTFLMRRKWSILFRMILLQFFVVEAKHNSIYDLFFQGHAEDLALRSIVTASCNWIRAGLPLKCLKIVVYTNNPASLSPAQNDLLEIFSKLQKKWKNMNKQKVIITL